MLLWSRRPSLRDDWVSSPLRQWRNAWPGGRSQARACRSPRAGATLVTPGLPGELTVLATLNPTRAHVVGQNGKEYRVPYAVLTPCETTLPPSRPLRTETALAAIGTLARALLAHHHLSQWRFQFDNATKRAGCCHYARQQISLSYEFAQQAADEEIRDTLLHEIAHALVGKAHQHDEVWRAKALEIGCSGRRCYDRQFTAPRYIVRCENRCWVATSDRRRRGVVCQQCHGQLVYITYTEERWKHERATRAPWTKASGSA